MILSAVLAVAVLPRYHVVARNGFSFLAGNDEKPFFSLGVCCVGTGTSFDEYDKGNPSYAAYQYYPEGKASWAQDTVQRLLSWKFNTVGAWSDTKLLRTVKAPSLRFTPILHMGSSAGAPWRDMWDPKIVGLMNDVARDQIKDLRNDSRVIGYFSDNEQGWWNAALFDWAWKGTHTRQKLVEMLKKRYGNWPKLMQDFDPQGAKSFAELEKSGLLFLRAGGSGIVAVHDYVAMLSDRYYSLCNSIIKKYDPGALYLGDRFISNYYPDVARSAGKYSDVVSTNLNADWSDGTLSPFYLPSLHRNSGKPLMITEYYMCAKQNRSGNKNDSSGFPVVETQTDRALGFRTTTEALLQTPYVVGAHWFQYYDEPKNGRGDGENYNMGLVDVNNEPYEELTQAAASLSLLDRSKAAVNSTKLAPTISTKEAADLEKWPRIEAYIPPSRPSDRGDAFLTWTPEAAYLAVYWNEDRFSEGFYRGGKVPIVDEPVISIVGLKSRASVRLVEKHSSVVGPISLVALKSGVRNTAIIRIPSGALGLTEISAGSKLPLDFVLQTRSRAYTIHWICVKTASN